MTSSTQGELLRLAGLLSTARTRRAAVNWGIAGPGINDETVANTSQRCIKAHQELAEFLDTVEASQVKGWALAKSLQAQIDILLPVVKLAADNNNERGIGPTARKALDTLAAHKEPK